MDFLASGANLLFIIVGFGLLIGLHELGHFVAAKWAGIRTESFAIGFGPPIFSWRRGVGFCWGSTDPHVKKRCGHVPRMMTDAEIAREGLGETEYSLRWLPLGGFVRMLGQDDLDPAAGSAMSSRSFAQVSIGKRMVVISAGVVMNVIVAMVCFVIALGVGVKFEAPVIGLVGPGMPAAHATQIGGVGAHDGSVGLEPGDRVSAIDGSPIETFSDLQIASAMSVPGDVLRMDVVRPGVDGTLVFDVVPELIDATGMIGIGVQPASSTTLAGDRRSAPLVQARLASDGLSQAGIAPGWTLDSADGHALTTWGEFARLTRDGSGHSIETVWSGPDGGHAEVSMTPSPQWEPQRYPDATPETRIGWEYGLAGFIPLVQVQGVMPDSVNVGVLEPGDVVLEFDGIQAPSRRAFLDAIASIGTGRIVVLRDGERVERTVNVHLEGVFEPQPKLQITTTYAFDVPLTARPLDSTGTPTIASTASASILPGSRFVSLDGMPIEDWRDLWLAMHHSASGGSRTMTLVVENPTPGKERRAIELTMDDDQREAIAALGWEPPIESLWFDPIFVTRTSGGNPLTALAMGADETWKFIVLTYLTVDRLFRGTVGVEQLHGPVGIVHLGTRLSDRGFMFLLFFLAIISINLAVLNFLPLPIVDGGLFLYLVYEKIRGRPPSVGFQNASMMIGLMLIATLFLVTFYNDLVRLIG